MQFSIRRGFTLVELSIVLVIIGLIIGGVVVGRDLIHAAEIRAQITQLKDYEVAFNTFRAKYNCLPGDCLNGSDFFSLIPGDSFAGFVSVNGDGNGHITNRYQTTYDDYSDWWPDDHETRYFFSELEQAGLVKSHFTLDVNVGGSLPALKLNPRAGFFASDAASFANGSGTGTRTPNMAAYACCNTILWMVASSVNGNANVYTWDNAGAIFTPADLQNMDAKMDDGLPLSGHFFGFGGFDASQNNCLTGDSYNVTIPSPQCMAAYVIQ